MSTTDGIEAALMGSSAWIYTAPREVSGGGIKRSERFTDDTSIAIEFADMGYTVEPNPQEESHTCPATPT